MPISDNLQTIFIHIPKTAGTSVEKTLGIFGGISKKRMFGLDMQHYTANELKEEKPLEWETYFKFTIVRNPINRIVSEHAWRCRETNLASGLDAFIFYFIEKANSLMGNQKRHLMPQTKFLNNEIDFTAKFENLSSDWQSICKQVGEDFVLSWDNKSSHSKNNAKLDLSKESISKIEHFYSDDFKQFGYQIPSLENYEPSTFLKDIDKKTDELTKARTLLNQFKSENKFCEIAIASDLLKQKFPDKPISWIHGAEAMLLMRDFGNAKTVLDEALSRFDNYHIYRLANNLARALQQNNWALEISKQMVEIFPSKIDSSVRHLQDTCNAEPPNPIAIKKARSTVLNYSEPNLYAYRTIRESYKLDGNFENCLKYSVKMAKEFPTSSALMFVLEDLSQLETNHETWSWFNNFIESNTIDETIKARVKERLTYMSYENLANRMSFSDSTSLSTNSKITNFPGPIHLAWLQGKENAPKIVQFVIDEWKRLNPEIEVNFYDECEVYNHLAHFKIKNIDKIPAAALSDIFRTYILSEKGGVWVDSTLLPTQSVTWIYNWLLQPHFFCFDGLTNEKFVDSWFIISKSGGHEISLLLDKILNFWSSPRQPFQKGFVHPKYLNLSALSKSDAANLVTDSTMLEKFPYFWWHYLFNSCVFSDSLFEESYLTRKVRPSPLLAHRLQFYLKRTPNPSQNTINQILEEFPLHKLTHKLSGNSGLAKGLDYLCKHHY